MKSVLALLVLVSFNFAHAAETSSVAIDGIYDTNAAILGESLLSLEGKDSAVTVDRSVYTVTKVTRDDGRSAITCARHKFSGPPAQYFCTISQK